MLPLKSTGVHYSGYASVLPQGSMTSHPYVDKHKSFAVRNS